MNPRSLLLIVVVAIFSALVALYATGNREPYRAFFWVAGVNVTFKPYMPFADSDEVISAIECHRMGVNVFVADPCDPLGRPHAYSPLWLLGSLTSVSQRDLNWIGIGLVLAFLAVVIGIAPISSYGDAAITLVSLLSQSSLFAMERANIDLVMFLLVTGGALLFTRASVGRIAAYASIFLAALLKFYPALGLGLALYERPRRFALVAITSILGGVSYILLYRHSFQQIWPNIPRPGPFGDAFGGINFFEGVGSVLTHLMPTRFDSYLPSLQIVFFVGALCIALKASFSLAPRMAAAMKGAPPGTGQQVFVAGGFILVGAFFLGQNVAYRGIWLLTILQLVMHFRHTSPDRSHYKRFWSAAVALILMLMWLECFHKHVTELLGGGAGWAFVLFVREPLWWMFIVGLMAALWAQLAVVTPAATLLAIMQPRLAPVDRR